MGKSSYKRLLCGSDSHAHSFQRVACRGSLASDGPCPRDQQHRSLALLFECTTVSTEGLIHACFSRARVTATLRKREMEFRKVLALRGPNIWASFPVLEAWVDLGPLKDFS